MKKILLCLTFSLVFMTVIGLSIGFSSVNAENVTNCDTIEESVEIPSNEDLDNDTTMPSVESPSNEDTVAGDIDGDGVLSNADISLMIRHLSGWDISESIGTGCDILVCDVTGDGKVNNRDVIWCIQELAGWHDEVV